MNLEATDLLREAQDASERRQTLLASGMIRIATGTQTATRPQNDAEVVKYLPKERKRRSQ